MSPAAAKSFRPVSLCAPRLDHPPRPGGHLRAVPPAASDPLPYYVPGIGAWPGHVVRTVAPGGGGLLTMWRYTVSAPPRDGEVRLRTTVGYRPLDTLQQLTPDLAGEILAVLMDPPIDVGGRQTWKRRLAAYREKITIGPPVELAEVFAALRAEKAQRALAFGEGQILDEVRYLLRTVLVCLPASPEQQRCLEIVTG